MTPSSPSSTTERAQQTTSAAPNIKERRVTMLTGMDVKDSAGEDVGNVEGFVVDLSRSDPNKTSKPGSSQRSSDPTAAGTPQTGQQVHSGQLIFTVVSFGGIVGIGEKYSLVPSNRVNLQPTQHMATLNATKQALEAMAFAPDKFPDLENREYVREVYRNFGEQPYWSALGYVSPSQQQQADAQSAWAPGSDYNKQFNAKEVETIKGTVESVGTFEPHRGVREGLRLRVKTDSGRFITVHAGPQWYAQQQGFALKSGDQVTITGSRIKHHMRTVLMASEIQSDGKTLQLRSKTGEPMWRTQGRSGQMSQPSSRSQTPNP